MSVALPTLGVYVGFDLTANAGSWTLGTSDLGTGTVLGSEYTTAYTDVAADVRAVKIERGKSRPRDQYPPGRCTVVLDNRSRDYDPLNLSGPYVTTGVTDVKPGRWIYITATDPTTGTVSRMFTGRIRNWKLDYTGVFDSTATIEATDVLADVAQTDVAFTSDAGYTGDTAGEILAQAEVPGYAYSVGVFPSQSMVWDTNALAALRTVALSEVAEVYCEANGDVYFQNSQQLVTDLRSRISQATFGSGDLTYESIDIDYDSDLILNSIALTRTGGVEQTTEDATSIASYGKRSFSATGLVNSNDTDVATVATALKSKYSEPNVRVQGITFHPQKHSSMMTQALERRLRDRVTVTFSPVGGGSAISQEVFITRISHTMSGGEMVTRFGFESSDWSHGWILGIGALGTTAELGL